VYIHGVKATGRYLVLFLVRAVEDEGRFGVTASRRVGKAVVRSRCKRRLRELYRLHHRDLGGRDFDVVVNARRGCATAPWDRLERDFQFCLRRGIDLAARVKGGGDSPAAVKAEKDRV